MTRPAALRKDLLGAVAAAIRAPSVHNTQPWAFRLRDGSIDVMADPARQLVVADPDGTAMRISCGAAILNVRLAVAHLGHAAEVALLPDPATPTLLATVTPGALREPSPVEATLYQAIPRRHSNRQAFLNTNVPLDLRATLREAATTEGAWLDLIIGPAAVEAIAALVRAADRILMTNEAYRTELSDWSRPDDLAPDGVPRRAAGPAPDAGDLLVRRDFGGAPRAPGRDFERDPLVGVLGSHTDSPRDDLVAGQALQRVLLTATSAGLMTSLLSQPFDVPTIREELRVGLRRFGSPKILIRVGYGIAGPTTPRRPIAEVLVGSPDDWSR